MDEQRARLERCFAAVFPDLSTAAIAHATPLSVPAWDSIANVTLIAVVEEEFGITIESVDLEHLSSFDALLDYLTARV
jgi:acyl carrier protein